MCGLRDPVGITPPLNPPVSIIYRKKKVCVYLVKSLFPLKQDHFNQNNARPATVRKEMKPSEDRTFQCELKYLLLQLFHSQFG